MAATKWNNAAADNKWSTVGNWTVNLPATTDPVTFDSTSTANCTVDGLGTWSGGTLTIASTYSGTITQSSGINMTTAAFSQVAGTFTGNSGATFTSTTFSVTGGTFNQGGAFVSTTFTIGAGTYVGSSATMSTTAVVINNNSTALTATSGNWTVAGSWTGTNNTTFTHNSGTITVTTTSTFNDPRSAFNKIIITMSGNTAFTVNGNTTIPLGANPTSTCGTSTMTVGTVATPVITWSGTWTHTGILLWTSGTMTGTFTPAIAINQNLNINSATTITNAIGTITFNGTTASTLTDTGDKLSGSTTAVTKSGTNTFAVAASTICRLGTTPTSTTVTSAFTVTGEVRWDGLWTHTGSLTVTGTLTGTSTPTISLDRNLTTSGATITNPIGPVTFTGASSSTYTDTSAALTASTFAISKTAGFTIAANTSCNLGASPTTNCGTGGFVITGTLLTSGTWSHTGAVTITATTGTITGALTAVSFTRGWSAGANATFPSGLNLTHTPASGGATFTFTGGGYTYGTLRRTGSNSNALVIDGSNTFTTLRDNDGTVAHTLQFTAGTTQTVTGSVLISGALGAVVSLQSTSAGSKWTMTAASGSTLTFDYISVKDSTVDAAPIVWYAGVHSADEGNNTNWVFAAASQMPRQTAIIAGGSTTSQAMDTGNVLTETNFEGIVFPATFTGATVGFQVSVDGTTYQDLYDSSNSIVSITAVDGATVGFTGDTLSVLGPWRYIKMVSASSETNTRTVQLLFGGGRSEWGG